VAVLHEDALARVVEELRVERQVELAAAAVQLDAVKAVVHDGVDVALVAGDVVAVVRADAVVAVPAGREAERVRVVGHGDEVREALLVHDGAAVRVVEGVLVRAVAAALLPVVVEAHVAVAEVAQRHGLAVHRARAVRDGRHLAHDQALVHVRAEEVPRAPAGGKREREREGGEKRVK